MTDDGKTRRPKFGVKGQGLRIDDYIFWSPTEFARYLFPILPDPLRRFP